MIKEPYDIIFIVYDINCTVYVNYLNTLKKMHDLYGIISIVYVTFCAVNQVLNILH